MNIKKFNEFIKENIQDTPEEYVKTALFRIKNKIDSFFKDDKEESADKVASLSNALKDGKLKKKDESEISLKDLNISLESSEISTYSSLSDNLTIKFSDEGFMYNLLITINLEDGISKDKTKDFSDSDIKECSVKFKKYDIDSFDLIGQIGPKKVKIDDISEEFLVSLKVELDDKFGEKEEFEIETE